MARCFFSSQLSVGLVIVLLLGVFLFVTCAIIGDPFDSIPQCQILPALGSRAD